MFTNTPTNKNYSQGLWKYIFCSQALILSEKIVSLHNAKLRHKE